MNGDLRPADVAIRSRQRIWWRCPRAPDHVWQTLPRSRIIARHPCPFCAGKRASITNSLEARAPRIAAEWHPTKNRPLTPRDVTTGTPRRVWWRCPKGPDHEWPATIHARTARGNLCPFCAGHRVSATNCLARVRPDIAKFWHSSKNGVLTPRDVLPGSRRAVWWQCPRGPDHTWRGPVNNKTRHGCPFCKGRALCASNSLASLAPKVAAQWHPRKNGALRPTDVFHRSGRVVWWKCEVAPDHEWRTAVVNRRRMGPGCPFCRGKWLAPSSSLASRFPALAAEWHPSKNGRLRAGDVHPGAQRHVWWKCAAGRDHEWQADVRVRVAFPRCPFCSGRRASVTNSLAKLFPKVAREWNRARNRDITAGDVLAASREYAWWRCPLGHDWRARISDRTLRGRDCPLCAEAVLRKRSRSGNRVGTGGPVLA